MLICRRNLIR